MSPPTLHPPRSTLLSRRAAIGVMILPLLSLGCEKEMEAVKKMAEPALDAAMPLVERDTKQIREGLPKGAELLAKHLDDEPGSDREGLRRAIKKARAGVEELVVAKSTFFVFVSPKGVVLRGESEPDLAADKSLVEAVPATKKVLKKDAGLVEAWGYMEGLRGVNEGDDLQWIVGHPVVKDGELLGVFVTGFSLRSYAKVLELALQSELEKLKDSADDPAPLSYAFVLKGKRAFGAPVTPDENMQTIGKLGIIDSVKGGSVFRKNLTIDGREFHLIAKHAPALGDDVAVAALLSPV